jgi:hypothetical protein
MVHQCEKVWFAVQVCSSVRVHTQDCDHVRICMSVHASVCEDEFEAVLCNGLHEMSMKAYICVSLARNRIHMAVGAGAVKG